MSTYVNLVSQDVVIIKPLESLWSATATANPRLGCAGKMWRISFGQHPRYVSLFYLPFPTAIKPPGVRSTWTAPTKVSLPQRHNAMGERCVTCGQKYRTYLNLVGGWATPLKNMKVNWDD